MTNVIKHTKLYQEISYFLLQLKLLFRKDLGFHLKENDIFNKYYSSGKNRADNKNTLIVCMVDGRTIHGGLSDRLRGIVSSYLFAIEMGFEFKLYYKYPFELTNYLVPNKFDWIISEEDISYNSMDSKVVFLNDYELSTFFHKFYLNMMVGDAKQIHLYTNSLFMDKNFSSGYNELFKPSPLLQKEINYNLEQINGDYLEFALRFQKLLGDEFEERIYKTISQDEAEKLIVKCINKIDSIYRKSEGIKKILITSDSMIFLEKIKEALDYVYVIPGKVVHIDNSSHEENDTYLKTFIDFYMIAKARKIYLICTGDMYKSGFAKRASKIYNTPYEEVIF